MNILVTLMITTESGSCRALLIGGGEGGQTFPNTRHTMINIDNMHQRQTRQKLKLERLWTLSGTQKLLRTQKTRSKVLRNHSRTCKKDIFSSKRIAQKEGESPWFDPKCSKVLLRCVCVATWLGSPNLYIW